MTSKPNLCREGSAFISKIMTRIQDWFENPKEEEEGKKRASKVKARFKKQVAKMHDSNIHKPKKQVFNTSVSPSKRKTVTQNSQKHKQLSYDWRQNKICLQNSVTYYEPYSNYELNKLKVDIKIQWTFFFFFFFFWQKTINEVCHQSLLYID